MNDITFVVEETKLNKDGKITIQTFDEPKKINEFTDEEQYSSVNSKEHNSSKQYAEDDEELELKVRFDKWLWAARFFKTRALARKAIESRKAFYNGAVTSPNTEIEIGSTISIFFGKNSRVDLVIRGLSTRRRNASDANELYTIIKTPINFHQDFNSTNSYNNNRNNCNPYRRKRTNNQTTEQEYNSNNSDYKENNYPGYQNNQYTNKRNSTTRFLRGRRNNKDSIENDPDNCFIQDEY